MKIEVRKKISLLVQFQFSVLLETIVMIISHRKHTHTHKHTQALIPSAFPGGGFDCSLTDNWESEKLDAESVKTSFSSHVTSRSPGENSHNLPPQSQFTASEHFQENILDHPSEFFFF